MLHTKHIKQALCVLVVKKNTMKKILLVEDDPEITKLLTLHLNAPSYQLISCNIMEWNFVKNLEKKMRTHRLLC